MNKSTDYGILVRFRIKITGDAHTIEVAYRNCSGRVETYWMVESRRTAGKATTNVLEKGLKTTKLSRKDLPKCWISYWKPIAFVATGEVTKVEFHSSRMR